MTTVALFDDKILARDPDRSLGRPHNARVSGRPIGIQLHPGFKQAPHTNNSQHFFC
jgi:hypothetical protein